MPATVITGATALPPIIQTQPKMAFTITATLSMRLSSSQHLATLVEYSAASQEAAGQEMAGTTKQATASSCSSARILRNGKQSEPADSSGSNPMAGLTSDTPRSSALVIRDRSDTVETIRVITHSVWPATPMVQTQTSRAATTDGQAGVRLKWMYTIDAAATVATVHARGSLLRHR